MAFATVTFGSRSTGFQVEASIAGASAAPVVFRVLARPGAPTKVVVKGGDGQIGLVNSVLDGVYDAVITDSYGNEVGGPLDWKVATGGGSLVEPPCDPETQWCPRPGRIHVLGPTDGAQTVIATANALPGKPHVTFTGSAVSAIINTGGGACYSGFVPSHVSVARGNTVAWFWCNDGLNDPATHKVTFEDGEGESKTMIWGWHLRTFTEAGTYRFRCTLHSNSFTAGEEVGTIVVK
jgi:plastocyanin